MSEAYALIAFLLACPIGLAVILYDLKTMTIPNWLSGGAFVIFAVFVFVALGLDDALYRLAGAGIVFVVTFILFALGQVGGGDAKAATAFALMVAPIDASFVLLALAVIGLTGLAVIAGLRRTALASGEWAVWSAHGRFPYGLTLGLTLILYTGLVAFLVA